MTEHFTLEQSIQTVLVLPELNKTETLRNLGMMFAAYHRCKLILVMRIELEIDSFSREANKKYEHAMDPDLIRVPYRVNGNSPHAFGTQTVDHLHMLEMFVYKVEHKVRMLPKIKGEIVKRRYLTLEEPLPTNTDVWLSFCENRFAISKRDYDRKKAQALIVLAYAFGVEVGGAP